MPIHSFWDAATLHSSSIEQLAGGMLAAQATAAPITCFAPSLGSVQLPLALKIDRNPDIKTVKGEYGTLRRLQAGCRQVVRVHDAAKHAGGQQRLEASRS